METREETTFTLWKSCRLSKGSLTRQPQHNLYPGSTHWVKLQLNAQQGTFGYSFLPSHLQSWRSSPLYSYHKNNQTLNTFFFLFLKKTGLGLAMEPGKSQTWYLPQLPKYYMPWHLNILWNFIATILVWFVWCGYVGVVCVPCYLELDIEPGRACVH